MVKFKDFEGDKRVVRSFWVKSKSDPGSCHKLLVFGDGTMECECPSGRFTEDRCWHRKLIRKFINREVLTSEELELFEEIK
jgi:hypothetical protein